jgi:3-methyl-2-oxobutanoate hydroxymethyltransferase
MVYGESKLGRTTSKRLQRLRKENTPITMLTCYDSSFARLLDSCGIDCILVGDSLGMVVQGGKDTLSVSLSDMEYHTRIVAGSVARAFVVADMPFGSYQTRPEETFANAARLIQAGAQMVKLEGGGWVCDTISYLVQRDIPVCGHVGLTPQSVHRLGGYAVQGKGEDAQRVLEEAKKIEDAGAQLLVLEAIPSELATEITQSVSIPTIGIGAGSGTSGQVLVLHDLLGVSGGNSPKFVRNFMEGSSSISDAICRYISSVQSRSFPGKEHEYPR